ncbi:hypothetical protein WMY93_031085 [Mugilogobius chulae]|uniref:DNA polymerase n=1 Tax=Mugilogobius chulae TaxID=88201 RepID=A0AAW0MIU0_9GOBI
MTINTPFWRLFPDLYPQWRSVDIEREKELIGVLIKSVMYNSREESLLCRGLVLITRAPDVKMYSTVTLKITRVAVVVGYDMDLVSDQESLEETWELVKVRWYKHLCAEPVRICALHLDIVRHINALVFPFIRVSTAKKFLETVKGALTFGDFCAEKGYYLTRDGNTPALCTGVMFGRVYYVPQNKLNGSLLPSELVYDHNRSEEEARLFESRHCAFFYKAACLDIETVCHDAYRDANLRSDAFAHKFPFCTERKVADLLESRARLVQALDIAKGLTKAVGKKVLIPPLNQDMPGQQHEITCVSLVVLNSHLSRTRGHRKKLIVLYNGDKVHQDRPAVADKKVTTAVGIEDVERILIYPCSGELALLEKTIETLYAYGIELIYVFNAEFDLRVIQQRVHFYFDSDFVRQVDPGTRRRCSSLMRAWLGLFVTGDLSGDVQPLFQFENVRYLEMYTEMIHNLGCTLLGEPISERALLLASSHVERFNRDKAKLGHFKMNACGMNVVDLYRMVNTRDVKFACTSMKLNDVAPYLISKLRETHGKAPKDVRKLRKLADVTYCKIDEMIAAGGESLFAVLVYNLVDSQLCARLAKVLRPVSSLFHRCRSTLNIDVVSHGRGDTFVGFVQSIHSVQLPQLKYKLDTFRVRSGPAGKHLKARLRWDPNMDISSLDNTGHLRDQGEWLGGQVSEPLTGLHYSGPGMGLELSFDFSSMYPSIMCALNVSPDTLIPWPPVHFPHDLSGWVCYSWEAEGFPFASLILKHDRLRGEFVRAPGVLPSAVQHYLELRSAFKTTLSTSILEEAERQYYRLQETECKVIANSFYGTAGPPCGPLLAAHGRRQISLVNDCVSSYFGHRFPAIYGDTDSVMVSCGYGPEDGIERDVSCMHTLSGEECLDAEALPRFAEEARTALENKFKRCVGSASEFVDHVHKVLVEDALERMYVIGRGNESHRVVRATGIPLSSAKTYPVYTAHVLDDASVALDVTTPFIKDRRVRLEYEGASSIYCHVSKKAYVALTHSTDMQGRPCGVTLKARGLSAHKSIRSPSDSAVTDSFLACVMRGDCLKLEENEPSCFTTIPWHGLRTGDVILYPEREPVVDKHGVWTERHDASSFLVAQKVVGVHSLRLNKYLAAFVYIAAVRSGGTSRSVIKTLHSDDKYCMNHVLNCKEGIIRDLLACKASELVSSRIGAGFFPWSGFIKSSKVKCFGARTLQRLRASRSSVKVSYVEIVKTNLKRITGLSVKPVQCHEFHKCHPCEATLYRYPLKLPDVTVSVFGAPLKCDAVRCETEGRSLSVVSCVDSQPKLISHPYHSGNKCYANSRVLLAHRADVDLMNSHMKLMPHCVVDYCLSRRMYSPALGESSIEDCMRALSAYVNRIKGRLTRASLAFSSLMNNCPEHMMPVCGSQELQRCLKNREVITRIPADKLEVCIKVIQEDMNLRHPDAYFNLSASLGKSFSDAREQNLVSLDDVSPGETWISLTKLLQRSFRQQSEGRLPSTDCVWPRQKKKAG